MPPLSKEQLWSSGKDETVEVNQRALIDKILARYSGEHTIFRELLQNADDAGAEHVQVKFYTEAGLEALDKGEGSSRLPNMHRYVVCNDGIPFRQQDWQRLKKIAEGNPDEEKIGAFGVGFYSLWSVCDDPFVESGDKWMGFYWKDGKDQLLARSGDLPASSSSSTGDSTLTGHPWTTFSMGLREPSLLEGPLDLARFFITSITFMRTVRKIDMLVDGIRILEVEKSVKGKGKVLKKGLRTSSINGMMTIHGVDATGMVITAKVMQWLSATGFVPPPLPQAIAQFAKPAKGFASMLASSFFGRQTSAPTPAAQPAPAPSLPEDPLEITTLHRDIQIYQADIKVSISPAFGRELERATKKPPPTRMPASVVFSRGEPTEEAKTDDGKTAAKDIGGVFGGLCPPLDSEKSAKVFIGQATSQTTGIGGHLAARFIPTVERESIDLVDRHVSYWNKELLWVGGYLSRLIYELEMQELRTAWIATSSKPEDKDERDRILKRGLHALRFFTFKTTTPSNVVGQEMESAFYGCATDNRSLPIVSVAGILPISEVRMPSADLQKFLPDLPVITPSAIEEASKSIARLRERSLLKEVTFDDVVKQLNDRPLTEKEMVDCLTWWQAIASMDGVNPSVRNKLLEAAILIQDNGKVLPLSTVQTFVKPHNAVIPSDMPLPDHTLPYSLTKDLKANSIYTIFGWTELSVLQYITFLINPPLSNSTEALTETDIRVSPEFAEKVLGMLGRAWANLAANQQTAIALELKEVSCIPTRAGFKKPSEAYFEKNLLFADLPTIALPKGTAIKGGTEKMLLAIGVRKTVDLQLVFSRLVGGGSWTCQDLMKYLVSVKDSLSDEELKRLKQTAAFPLEIGSPEDGSKKQVIRQKPHQLYEPVQAMRDLGLPLLDWGEGKWRHNSDEAKLLFTLGLRRYPPIDVLLGIAAGRAPANEKALQYLLVNTHNHYPMFGSEAFSEVAFIPAKTYVGDNILAKPGRVFTNPQCSILGFSVAQPQVAAPENAAKLGIQSDPPMEQLIEALKANVTRDTAKAKKIFEYMSTRLGHSLGSTIDTLRSFPFIPVTSSNQDVNFYRPNQVYFVTKDGGEDLYKSAFTFVDFGERANIFLRYCGVRSEPSVKDIAVLLMSEPHKMLEQAGSAERYLEQLRLLAANWMIFDQQTRTSMKTAPFLLASQRVHSKMPAKKLLNSWTGGNEDNDFEREWVLCKASEVSVVDSVTMLQYFGQYILAAPEEHILEEFYASLGAKSLSSFVKRQYISDAPNPHPSDHAQALRRHVLERLTIFLAEARRKQSEYTSENLSQEGNFTVQEVKELKVRYTYKNGRNEYHHYETLYATASRGRGKAIILTISTTAQMDDYDIASALCDILLRSAKADDALLLYSILSTPLMALKKRGFNVDRILNLQKEEKLRVQAERKRQQIDAIQSSESNTTPSSTAMVQRKTSIDSTSLASSSTANEEKDGSSLKSKQGLLNRFRRKSTSKPPSMPGGLGGEILNQLKAAGAGGWDGAMTNMAGRPPSFGPSGSGGPGTAMGGMAPPNWSTKRPTDLNNIRSTVQKALDASRPEKGTQITDSRQAVRDVSESQDNYCDTTAQADIVLGEYSSAQTTTEADIMNCYPDVPDQAAFLGDKIDICYRFSTEILLPICKIFNLAPAVMNVFWDHSGPLIAFNRGGTIFCNARYYQAWHDTQIQNGQTNEAFISWYFSIAHELAHNLESAHNSAHEFYFSSIAEEYLIRFIELLATRPNLAQQQHLLD
uniref:Sacsin/Nov domain-containing protein n=1 Tax=Kwoniella pini CBS 10737 TaxID=1296096 RepID=A0A1B9I337_9TREE|nr:uncharacterized protein I206_04455 [Kwoniella pini CBS 10737]OCF49924.1 hypothetical protein I206_04455 [Kwoniella pini CBS 10737]